MKTMVKEARNDYVIAFPSWLAHLCHNIHLTPQGLVVKPGKADRLVWDGSFLINYDSTCINSMQDPSKSPPIYYGDALTRHFTRIYNLRVTYPNDEIYLWDDDVSGATEHVNTIQT